MAHAAASLLSPKGGFFAAAGFVVTVDLSNVDTSRLGHTADLRSAMVHGLTVVTRVTDLRGQVTYTHDAHARVHADAGKPAADGGRFDSFAGGPASDPVSGAKLREFQIGCGALWARCAFLERMPHFPCEVCPETSGG